MGSTLGWRGSVLSAHVTNQSGTGTGTETETESGYPGYFPVMKFIRS